MFQQYMNRGRAFEGHRRGLEMRRHDLYPACSWGHGEAPIGSRCAEDLARIADNLRACDGKIARIYNRPRKGTYGGGLLRAGRPRKQK